MRRNTGLRSFLWRLAAALPANLAVFWMVLRGNTPAILLCGVIGAVTGALLLMAMEARDPSEQTAPALEPTARMVAPEHQLFARRWTLHKPGGRVDQH